MYCVCLASPAKLLKGTWPNWHSVLLSLYLYLSLNLSVSHKSFLFALASKQESQTGTLDKHCLQKSQMILQWPQHSNWGRVHTAVKQAWGRWCRSWASICGIYSSCIHFLYTRVFPCTGHISLPHFTVPVHFLQPVLGRAVQSGWEMCACCSSYFRAWGIQGQRAPIRVTWTHKTSIWLMRQHKRMQTVGEGHWLWPVRGGGHQTDWPGLLLPKALRALQGDAEPESRITWCWGLGYVCIQPDS